MALYTVRRERQFWKQLDYNLLFRWFLDMNLVKENFVPAFLTKNREADEGTNMKPIDGTTAAAVIPLR